MCACVAFPPASCTPGLMTRLSCQCVRHRPTYRFSYMRRPLTKGSEPGTSDAAAQGRNQLLCPSATFDLKSIRFLMLWWNISKRHEQRTQSIGSRVQRQKSASRSMQNFLRFRGGPSYISHVAFRRARRKQNMLICH